MNKKDARKRIEELKKITSYHAKKYYDDDEPEISDFEYDMLMLELKNLENEFPEFITSDSLTQHVGGNVKEGFEKVEHEVPLQSLQDIFNFDDLYAFDERVKKTLETDKTAAEYVFFIISGTENTRVWIGNSGDQTIVEIFECSKVNGIYFKQ